MVVTPKDSRASAGVTLLMDASFWGHKGQLTAGAMSFPLIFKDKDQTLGKSGAVQ